MWDRYYWRPPAAPIETELRKGRKHGSTHSRPAPSSRGLWSFKLGLGQRVGCGVDNKVDICKTGKGTCLLYKTMDRKRKVDITGLG